MRVVARLALVWLALGACSWTVGAQEGFDDPVLNERYRALIHEIRCPKCLNESIGESKAPVAADLRREVRRLLGEGASDEDVKTFLASRYGEFVLYSPPLTPTTFAVWAAPFVLVALGGFVFWRILVARRNQPLDEELPP